MLVANKNDLENQREVSKQEAKEFAQKNNIQYIEASAKKNINIE